MFFEAVDLYRTLDLKSNPVDSSHFENTFKRTINCLATRAPAPKPCQQLATRANMNLPSKQRAYRRYLCSVAYVTQKWGSYHEHLSFIVK